jgi:hypothetical protein
MPIDQTQKRRQLARVIIAAATGMMGALENGADCAYEYGSAGLTFVDSDFAGQSDLQHIDAATLTNALTIFTSVKTYFQNNNLDDVMLKLKP